MVSCKDCLHYKPCKDWSMDCFHGNSKFPYEAETAKKLCEYYTPTADVVPRAEVARLQNQVNRLKKYDEERDIALHSRLISNAKTEVAREIICEILLNNTPDIDGFFTMHESEISKLEKKYTEEHAQ